MLARVAPTIVFILFAVSAGAARAQTTLRPSEAPTVFADNESWYVSQGPLAYGGGIYYPSGPIIHFVPSEMLPSGSFERVTIYTRTTVEPRSVIYVPLQGGLMRPYERLRTGELAGTVGSTSPIYPVAHPSDPAVRLELAQTPSLEQRPIGTSGFVTAHVSPDPSVDAQPMRAVASTGTTSVFPKHPLLSTAQRPVGLNGVYVEFNDARWFADGPSVPFDAERFTRIGEYRGFGVYQEKGRTDRIYIALFQGQPGLMGPYKQR